MPSARILQFPIHPVIVRGDPRGWLVLWRSCVWLHATRDAALADAHAIASTHSVRVIVDGAKGSAA